MSKREMVELSCEGNPLKVLYDPDEDAIWWPLRGLDVFICGYDGDPLMSFGGKSYVGTSTFLKLRTESGDLSDPTLLCEAEINLLNAGRKEARHR